MSLFSYVTTLSKSLHMQVATLGTKPLLNEKYLMLLSHVRQRQELGLATTLAECFGQVCALG